MGFDSQLCFVNDNLSMFPLQKAVIHGHGDVIRELLSACPESLQKLITSKKETVFHLAAKNYKCDAFQVLLKEAKKLNQEHLLDEQDDEGNTVLHIAVRNQLLPIVTKLVETDSFTTQVNAMNKKGETAMDLYNRIRCLSSGQIGNILQIAGGREAFALVRQQPSSTVITETSPWRFLQTKNVLLVIFATFIGLAFTVIFSLQSFIHTDNHNSNASEFVFEFKDVATGELPITFYIISSNTVAFTTSTAGILKLLLYYSRPYGHFMLLPGITNFFHYVLLAYYIMRKFFVSVASHYLSSYSLMWILVLSFIFYGALIICIAKCLLMRSHKFTKWLQRKCFEINLLVSQQQKVAPV
ncbi:hypothetical protein Ddye_013274 [Dipteronia dyeriana]|uniref:Ankyrin repeat-containing protein n=1 Tax=Dipteronia dyeriana TaxID=168575 RepID=A0AAD9X5Y5_9ROSI|nr:hypothetical protein Ddye_013274 [Dipteronia dyeriana]